MKYIYQLGQGHPRNYGKIIFWSFVWSFDIVLIYMMATNRLAYLLWLVM